MNIFTTSPCPIESAEYLDDVRANKMLLETAQMLATAIQLNGGQATYKATHKNHPCNIFVRETRDNYIWTLRHFTALCRRFRNYRNKPHGCEKYINEFIKGKYVIPEGELTAFPNCAANSSLGISYKDTNNVFLAYRLYLEHRWELDKRTPSKYGNIINLGE